MSQFFASSASHPNYGRQTQITKIPKSDLRSLLAKRVYVDATTDHSGRWWIEENSRLCFISIINKEACWVYEPMEDGRVYQNFSPYDGTLVHAFLEPAGSKLR